MKHDISYYSGGNLKVAFCRVCGTENQWELNSDNCSGKYVEADQKLIDKPKEPDQISIIGLTWSYSKNAKW